MFPHHTDVPLRRENNATMVQWIAFEFPSITANSRHESLSQFEYILKKSLFFLEPLLGPQEVKLTF